MNLCSSNSFQVFNRLTVLTVPSQSRFPEISKLICCESVPSELGEVKGDAEADLAVQLAVQSSSGTERDQIFSLGADATGKSEPSYSSRPKPDSSPPVKEMCTVRRFADRQLFRLIAMPALLYSALLFRCRHAGITEPPPLQSTPARGMEG
ncbi:hypothetical protein P4O66_003875 [Electrophorus voltai]|uniref:Uncharacterized protein n=1 Tax=Electrophorus voltai TaxID=2609070 RepID=A0AAD8ZS99_9TELE|nr:hypothetical protein P4O66_003875 [Electrophorus voltai]